MTRLTRMRLYNGLSIALFAGAASAVVLLTGCDYHSDKVSTEEAAIQINRPVGYAEVNARVLQRYCLECHVNRGPVLVDYDSVRQASEEIRKSAVLDKSMPKTGPLPADLQALLKAWLDQGSPEIAGETVPGIPPDQKEPDGKEGGTPDPETGTVKWADVSNQVFKKRCTQCHFTNNDQGRVSFSDPQSARDNIDAALSMALQGQMPPEGQEPLTKAQKLLLSRWVIDGMKE